MFVAKRQSRVKYKLCVREPTGGKDCFKKRTKKRGKPSSVGFFGANAPHTVGRYRFVWKVGGSFAAKSNLRVGSEFCQEAEEESVLNFGPKTAGFQGRAPGARVYAEPGRGHYADAAGNESSAKRKVKLKRK